MRLRIATEDVEPNHWIAWVLDLPGCYSSAPTEEAALALCPRRITDYFDWLEDREPGLVIRTIDFSTMVSDRFRSFYSPDNPDYYINAFFQGDEQPLSYWEVAIYQQLLAWSHQDLIDLVEPVLGAGSPSSPSLLQSEINSLLSHVAGAENWYFSHLGLEMPEPMLPESPFERLLAVRANSVAKLPHLVGDDRIVDKQGEKWSGRKILRRTLWHERDHLEQIQTMLQEWL